MSDTASWFKVGHVTYPEDRTGCTAVIFDHLSPAVVDVRGGAPGTRETELLQPGRQVGRVDGIVLTGSSAFGLAAADGVVRWLAEQGRGFPTSAGPVPIVPAAVIFDLAVGTPRKVTADDGYTAASIAITDFAVGSVGVGAGATVAKLGGAPAFRGGIATATEETAAGSVTAIIALNAVGDVREPDTGRWLARSHDASGANRTGRELALARLAQARSGEHTTIGVVLVSGAVSRDTLIRCGIAAHDGLARCIVPAHTLFDGDTFFAVAPESGDTSPTDVFALSVAAEIAVERAIVSLFSGEPASGMTIP